MVKNDIQIFFTKILLTIGTIGVGMDVFKNLEIVFSVVLKFISIISFLMVIIINYPKFVKTIKIFLKKTRKQ